MIDPLAIGGFRLKYNISYYKRFENRKSIFISPTINYGFRNGDIKGNLSIETLYNPKKLSRASVYYGKYFNLKPPIAIGSIISANDAKLHSVLLSRLI